MSIATVTSKGQVTLPAAVRRALSIETGDKLAFRVEQDRIVVERTPDFLSLGGSIAVPSEVRGASWDEIRDRAYRDRRA
jgi:AbrB family looped-hinge helix DNA binding protein